MLTGNKGEWSEIYTFFKLLAEQKVYGGDADLNKIEKLFYPIIKIIREEQSGHFEYELSDNVVLVLGGESELKIPVEKFKKISEKLLLNINSSNGTFSVKEVEEFMHSINCNSLKAKSNNKTDINIVLHDLRTNFYHQLGFSIKSQLGSPSTLLNASGDTTNFLFKIKGINTEIMLKANQITKFQEKFTYLKNLNAEINFERPVNSVFNNNLIYVDSGMPIIIASILLNYYSSPNHKISDIISVINEQNPLGFDYKNKHDFYEHKVKRFLTDIALGLKTSKPWKGIYEANGGYLIVKENGEIICYHIYDKNQFENYLFNNTKLETPSTTRHKFGVIFEEANEFFIKLNLQVRFI